MFCVWHELVFILKYLVEETIRERLGGLADTNVSHLEGRILVKGWRSRFIFTLLVFFAGFATAIHTLAPAPDDETTATERYSAKTSPEWKFNSEEFVEDLNSGMHKALEFGKKAAVRTGKVLRKKVKEMRDEMRDA